MNRLSYELMCSFVKSIQNLFDCVASVTFINFDEGALFVDADLRRKFKHFVETAPLDIKFASYEYKKAMRNTYSNDSLLKEYSGLLWEPMFTLKSFKSSEN